MSTAITVGLGLAMVGAMVPATSAHAQNSTGPRILISAPATVRGWGQFTVKCQTSHHLEGAKARLWIANDGILKDTRTVAPNGNCSMPVLIAAANGGPNVITVFVKYKGRKITSNTLTVQLYPQPPS